MEQERHLRVEPGSRRELDELIAKYDVALLTTRSESDGLHTRPMAMQRRHEPGEDLWFVAQGGSQKVKDIERDHRCGVALYGGSRDSDYVSLSGRAEIIRDRALIRQLWEPAWKEWFPRGADAEDVVMIRFVPEAAEYVHTPGGRLGVAGEIIKGAVTKKAPEPSHKRELDLGGLRASAWDADEMI